MKKITRFLLSAAILGGVGLASCEKNEVKPEPVPVDTTSSTQGKVVNISDADLKAGETFKMEAKNTYLLDGLVFLEESGVLEIEPGTVIKFKEKTGAPSALIISRGAKIMAKGTKDAPIIFTAEEDDLNGSLGHKSVGKWGGLILLGKSTMDADKVNTGIVEGINSNDSRGVFGGSDVTDNSGVLEYVSIRYTGIGIKTNEELQGLTLGAVGNGTKISHIDIFSSGDDGVEIFGGTVNIDHISVAFATDDDIDLDLFYRGNIQYAFSIQDETKYDHAGEWDGGKPNDTAKPTDAKVYNATVVGPGTEVDASSKAKRAFRLREGFTGHLANSIIVDFPGKGLEVEDSENAGEDDTYQRFLDGKIKILNNTWSQIKGSTDLSSLVKISSGGDNPDAAELKKHLVDNKNVYEATSVIGGISRERNKGLDPIPTKAFGDVATENLPSGIEATTYRGAFDPEGENWLKGWSTLDKFGYLK